MLFLQTFKNAVDFLLCFLYILYIFLCFFTCLGSVRVTNHLSRLSCSGVLLIRPSKSPVKSHGLPVFPYQAQCILLRFNVSPLNCGKAPCLLWRLVFPGDVKGPHLTSPQTQQKPLKRLRLKEYERMLCSTGDVLC
jgi:hypothetical protein